VIEVRSVKKSFGAQLVLKGIHLQIEESKTYVLLGESGCGKSTLLRLMMGLIPSDEGEVWIDERAVGPERRAELSQKIGYVIQEGGLFPHLSARENVALKARLLGWAPARIGERIQELTDFVQLNEELLSKFPVQLSGGQRQRVGLMRALMLNPDYIFLDEPLSALDPIVRSDLQRQLKEIFSRLKKTVVFVTHSVMEAAHFGDQILLLEGGRLVQQGSLRDLVRNPAEEYVTRFLSAQQPSPLVRELYA